MAVVHFTSHLTKFVDSEPIRADGATVAEALDNALDDDRLRAYVLDDQGRLRRHVTVFVDGKMIVDRVGLTDPLARESEVFVMQALSGG